MLEQGIHAGNTNAKFEPDADGVMRIQYEVRPVTERPGQGEIVGGTDYQLTEEIMALARKKGGKDEAQNLITSAISTARAEGQRIAAIGERKARVELERIMDDRIVCAFIAEANATAERFYGRFPPDMISNVSGLTLSKIIDALYRAGYTARGRRSPPDQAMS